MASSCGGGGGGGCQSQCFRRSEEEEEEVEVEGKRLQGLSISAAGASSDGVAVLCTKCGEEAAVYNNQCLGCFRSFLFGKFKLAVTSNAMISPVDNVLVAFSGGPGSRIALQFMHEMQLKSQKSWDASKDQALPVFGVGVAFIDESAVSLLPSNEVDNAIKDIRLIVSSLVPPAKELHITPIENICSLEMMDGKARLKKLLDTITDATGKEDFLQYLRMVSLQKVALDNGYNKLVLGSCTTGMACHIISATVKGQGYSLPADVQYIDARWEIPVVFPLRDCLAEELTMLCHLDGLKMPRMLAEPHCGINGLVSSFLSRLQEENPSRARTIVRTAEKLSPFCFNKLTENGRDDMLPSRMRRKIQNMRTAASTPSEVLCIICGGPLSGSDLLNLKSVFVNSHTRRETFTARCCESCSYQILPKEEDSFEDFYSFLPQMMIGRVKAGVPAESRWLREHVKEFLLSDEDEGT